jgi:hypothetical protein
VLNEGVGNAYDVTNASILHVDEILNTYELQLCDSHLAFPRSASPKLLLFWKVFVSAVHGFAEWNSKVSEFYSKQDRISGSMEVMITSMTQSAVHVEGLARTVMGKLLVPFKYSSKTYIITDIIRGTVECALPGTQGYFEGELMRWRYLYIFRFLFLDGIGALFSNWEQELLMDISSSVSVLAAHIDDLTNTFGPDVLVSVSRGAQHIRQHVHALMQKYLSPNTTLFAQLLAVLERIDALAAGSANLSASSFLLHNDTVSGNGANTPNRFILVDAACALELELIYVSSTLEDLHRCRHCARIVTRDLLAKHIYISQTMARIWESIQDSVKCVDWCGTGIEAANLIASEAAGLRLYSILNKYVRQTVAQFVLCNHFSCRNDLKDLLVSINFLSRKLLASRSQFQL